MNTTMAHCARELYIERENQITLLCHCQNQIKLRERKKFSNKETLTNEIKINL